MLFTIEQGSEICGVSCFSEAEQRTDGVAGRILLASRRRNSLGSKETVSFFDPEAFLAKVGHGRTVTAYGRGSVIFRQGAPADAVHYIQAGQVKISVTSEHGKNAVIAILGPKAFFGEGCLVAQPMRQTTAIVMADARIMRLEKETMVRVLRDEPTFAQVFINHLLARASRAEEDLADRLFHFTEKRLGRTLLRLANAGKEDEPQAVQISQGTLAEIVGTTRPRISHFMNKFRRLGFISYEGRSHNYNGRLVVHSSLRRAVSRE
jgi:CRP/FNR family transcriptional regulator, cyclic AMP receptor protein